MIPRSYFMAMTDREQVKLAYKERNLLALHFAEGWYFDSDNLWPGFRRVLSLDGGKMCLHIPDDFQVGNLPEIKPNWDGHTTEGKWSRVLRLKGINEDNLVNLIVTEREYEKIDEGLEVLWNELCDLSAEELRFKLMKGLPFNDSKS